MQKSEPVPSAGSLDYGARRDATLLDLPPAIADGSVDRLDLNRLLAGLNTAADGPAEIRDLDGDGRITILDAHKLALLCARPRCVTR